MSESVINILTDDQLNEVAVAAIIAEAISNARGITSERARWHIYNAAKRRINDLNPTWEEYQYAITLLAEALKI